MSKSGRARGGAKPSLVRQGTRDSMIVDTHASHHTVHNPHLKKSKNIVGRELLHDSRALTWEDKPITRPALSKVSKEMEPKNLHTSHDHPLLVTVERLMEQMRTEGKLDVAHKPMGKRSVPASKCSHRRVTLHTDPGTLPKKEKLLNHLEKSTRETWVRRQPSKILHQQDVGKLEKALTQRRQTDAKKKAARHREEELDSGCV
uniref:Uncharacterized protein n=1 Tax=Lotharella globosa TaxID=91324 RepID=A0A7S4E146_9EUKA